jgi:hypothetical protein
MSAVSVILLAVQVYLTALVITEGLSRLVVWLVGMKEEEDENDWKS